MNMRIYEIETIKPLTPERSRLNSLKQQKERASTALKTERERQKKAKAAQQMQRANQVIAKLN